MELSFCQEHAMYMDKTYWSAARMGDMHVEEISWNVTPYAWQWHDPMQEFARATTKDSKKKRCRRLIPAEIYFKGTHCTVRKHARLGCAVVEFESEVLQAAVLKVSETRGLGTESNWKIDPHEVLVRPHFDEHRNDFDRTSIFIHWGHKAEKVSPLPVEEVAHHFDLFALEIKVALEMGLQPAWSNEVPCSQCSVVSI
eukprot:TRINITY_DN13951_c0_g1_i2.p1 TRINITY_DN13951_c0_g1~~TRINITY_DN13951_c0_g1_i2.p1  ORF type:complete len:198 (-),score=35.48 TRINITY_DN13951_c0_g1_i2:359-952(-)